MIQKMYSLSKLREIQTQNTNKIHKLSQPHFGQSVRMRLTLPKVGTWSPLGLPQFQSSTTEGKTPLKCSLYHWKGLEVQMSKMASHESFGHLQTKLWAKEGSRVKLTV
jgi:hypothetical protein